MTEPREESLADIIVNRAIMGVIGGMILFFGVPMLIQGVDAIMAGLDGQPFNLWTAGVVIIGVILLILGAGMIWLAVKPPYRASK